MAERLRGLFLLTAVSGVGSSPAQATCETDWPVSYELK